MDTRERLLREAERLILLAHSDCMYSSGAGAGRSLYSLSPGALMGMAVWLADITKHNLPFSSESEESTARPATMAGDRWPGDPLPPAPPTSLPEVDRYAVERISDGKTFGEHVNFRITDRKTDSRIATCYIRENADFIVAELNAASELRSLLAQREERIRELKKQIKEFQDADAQREGRLNEVSNRMRAQAAEREREGKP